jgi:HPt (histidine-containing phosphotransfer) domain-containing protein
MTDPASARRHSSRSSTSVERPIDLVHLARMTLGERSLEREVLQLFDRQATLLMARLQDAPAEAVPSLAHTLKGSARAIGAVHVARAAEMVEVTGKADPTDFGRAFAELRSATEEACGFIADLLRAA